MAPKYPTVAGYQLVQKIGGGGFSTVFRAVNFDDHRVAACKVILITDQTADKDRKTVEKEMRVHSALKHENVLEFLNAVIVELKHRNHYIPGIYMLLELAAGGDLFDKIAPDVGVGDDVAHYYFQQMLSGVQYLHQEGVCHRDLKPENLLLDSAGVLKISDFGLSAVFKLKDSGKTRTLSERCGSLPYVAPELNSQKPYHAEPADAWGVGVILFTMLAGNTPWDEPTQNSREFSLYVSGEIYDEAPWDRFGPNVLSLIRGLLEIDPHKRMTLADAWSHPWCMRTSQLASQGPAVLADRITQSLRDTGDLELAAPDFSRQQEMDVDVDMPSATHQSQFTQSLMLFSQTQSGARYTPHLTRFYANVPPTHLMPLVQQTLHANNVQCKGPFVEGESLRLRIAGYDLRKQLFKGWVDIEAFHYRGAEGSFCVMQRDTGNPISWRQLWKHLISDEHINPYVLRK
ncbi:kinase-like domain-containing protein [Schizophyllum amplum]|uniref:Kinase-like domain-containing protein n=1 Tax=Schizophyllum amplum TaxID=97359 RepID=A0A550CCN6_9AGAR|nr:kinase-like domain-containing protein [Auriculariopsis ampla]